LEFSRRGGGCAGDENEGRRGGVGGWERQVFGSELSHALRRGEARGK